MNEVGEATVRSRSNIVAGIAIAVFPLIVACAPFRSGVVRPLWVLAWLGVAALVLVRAARMSVKADPTGLTVRSLVRDYFVPWKEVTSIDTARSDNISGRGTTVVIRRTDGTKLIGRGASSYSARTVERWRDELRAVRAKHG